MRRSKRSSIWQLIAHELHRQRRAKLCRDSGRIRLMIADLDAQAAFAVSLCKFLVARSIACAVEANEPLATAVQLRGVPNLDLVEQYLAEWESKVLAHPPEPPTSW